MRLLLPAAIVLSLSAAPAFAAEPRSGDFLRAFAKAEVRIVAPEKGGDELVELLLSGVRPRSVRRVSAREAEEAKGVVVRLIENPSEGELFIGAESGPRGTLRLTVSAPDAAWLRQGVIEARLLREPPREPIRRKVRSLAVICAGVEPRIASELVYRESTKTRRAFALPAEDWEPGRLAHADELILLDRSARPPAGLDARPARRGETIAWKEPKGEGGWRAVLSGPNAGAVEAGLRALDISRLGPEPTVLYAARDLTGVRRVAVSGLGRDETASALAQKLVGRAAIGLRALGAFEVLERDGLQSILSEIALSQAGITNGADRVRLRQLAAADTLLIVDITDCSGHTEITARHERLTPKIGPAPRRPAEPSRLRIPVSIRGRENDPLTRAVLEALLGDRVGYKDEWDYRDDWDYYQSYTLPLWQRQVRDWERERQSRPVRWREERAERGSATLRGSLRLVDLADGLVLWEAPFAVSDRGETPYETREITLRGDDTRPGTGQAREARAPAFLLNRLGDDAIAQALGALKHTALLPEASGADRASVAAGKIIDIDDESVLVGLGAQDGIAVGDTLLVQTPDGPVRLRVTRVRPRTCDARAPEGIVLSVGQSVEKKP